MSVWFCSSRCVVASLSGRLAAALMMKSRVHVVIDPQPSHSVVELASGLGGGECRHQRRR
jgi:hypothetical protein